MKNNLAKMVMSHIFILCMIFCMPPATYGADTADQSKTAEIKVESALNAGSLDNILFAKLPGKERVTLLVTKQPVVNIEIQSDSSLLVKMDNMIVSGNLLRVLGENELNNIVRVMPIQQVIDGKQWIYLTIDLKEIVPYAVKQEGQNINIDFNVSALNEKKPPAIASPKVSAKKQKSAKKNVVEKASEPSAEVGKVSEVTEDATEKEVKTQPVQPIKKAGPKRYTDRIISLDFQEAEIKSVLRLMAEYGNISIVAGDDVKGNVTLSMKNVPWEQALDSILDIQGLAKKQMGDVISVMTLERKKKDENDRMTAEKDQRAAEEERKNRDQKILAEKGKLRQILIEAKIVEASEDFVRNLGVNWGFNGNQSIGSYGMGLAGGTNSLQNNLWQRSYPPEITGGPLHMAAVNLPAALGSPTLGVVIGAGSTFLEAQLAAMESMTSGKIISAPKVVTMDNVKAIIKQGDEVPYIVQTATAAGVTNTVTFKEAVLRLEVKPKITDEGRISMEIKAGNDVPDYALGQQLFGNPPIHKNEIESTVVIQDGDTVVIGGVLRDQSQTITTGVPWLQKIPVLGWLFKTENITKQKKQLLVFITPKVLKGNGFVESASKLLNEKPSL
jgi:type IV pilus assembly protein PilQ